MEEELTADENCFDDDDDYVDHLGLPLVLLSLPCNFLVGVACDCHLGKA